MCLGFQVSFLMIFGSPREGFWTPFGTLRCRKTLVVFNVNPEVRQSLQGLMQMRSSW